MHARTHARTSSRCPSLPNPPQEESRYEVCVRVCASCCVLGAVSVALLLTAAADRVARCPTPLRLPTSVLRATTTTTTTPSSLCCVQQQDCPTTAYALQVRSMPNEGFHARGAGCLCRSLHMLKLQTVAQCACCSRGRGGNGIGACTLQAHDMQV